MTTHNLQMRARYRRIHQGGLHLKSLLAVIALVLDLVFMQARVFADLPEATPGNPNVAAGRKAIEAKDFNSAVKSLTKAVRANPKDADAHTMLGYSYRKLSNFDKSIEHYRKALKIDSSHLSAHEYLGELYLDMKQPANAKTQLQALKKACPFFGKCEEYDDLRIAIENYKTK
jgi:Tfp pilus assembly protein PilF